jgi:hypothetical protein
MVAAGPIVQRCSGPAPGDRSSALSGPRDRKAARCLRLAVMDSAVSLPADGAPRARSGADLRMRRLLRLPEDGPRVSIFEAQRAFGRSIALSATRCMLTYVMIPLLGPLLGLSGAVGPVVGLALGAVSMIAIVMATRRFFAADHKWRWWYAGVGGVILVLLAVQAVIDIVALVD